MKKLLIIGLLSLWNLIAQAEVKVQVDPAKISLDQTFRLTLTQDAAGGVPDLTVLQPDFVIMGTERNVNYSVINGQAQSLNQWVITLKAKRAGILTIPMVRLGTEESAPVTINVEADSQNSNQKNTANTLQVEDVLLKTAVNQKKPFVNQEVIYSIKLYNRKRLLDAEFQPPKVDDALLIPLGDAKRYESALNNVQYIVEEQRYAVFPQKSGALTITSPTFAALVYDLNPQRIKLQDKPTTLSVKPAPQANKNVVWLPAKQITLNEHYESISQNLKQGSTLIRTITIQGVAVPGQLLPNLKFPKSDGFNVYPEKGKERNEVKDDHIVGSAEIKVTYLFKKPGTIVIPEVKLPWFNTDTEKEEIATLPARTIKITAAATGDTTPNPVQQMIQQDNTALQPTATAGNALKRNTDIAWYVAILLALGWLITAGLWWLQRSRRPSAKRQHKKALAELNKACIQCNPGLARDALLKWAELQWPDAPILNLTDLTRLIHDASLKKQVHLLSQVLYKTEKKSLWRGDELIRAVQGFKRDTLGKKKTIKGLPPINPF